MSRMPQRRRSLCRAALAALFLVTGLTAPAGAGTVEVVSRIDPGFASDTPNGASQTYQPGTTSTVLPTVSADGRYLVFTSKASSLVNGFDTNNTDDVFLYDRQLGALTLVSHGAAGTSTIGNGASTYPVISADGRWVAYLSTATNLVTGQTDVNGAADVFLWDRLSNTSILVSRIPAAATTTGNGICSRPHVNDDGSFVTYASHATNLMTGQTDTASTYDVFLYDRAAGTNTLVSHTAASAVTTGNGHSSLSVLSGNGAWVGFTSKGTNLIPGQTDGNANDDVFLYERATGTVTLVSHTAASSITTGTDYSRAPILSQDGSWITYISAANNLAPGQADMNLSGTDIFLHERATGINTLVSHVAASATQTPSSSVWGHSASDDGRWIAYATLATNLVTGQTDTNNVTDVFLYDRTTGTSVLVSHISSSLTTTGLGNADIPVVSRDGSRVAFHGYVRNLVAGQTDTNAVQDVFVWERATGTVSLASHISPSSTTAGNAYAWDPVIGGNGSSVFYRSNSSNLWPKDKNNDYDVFFYDTVTGGVTLVSQRHPNMAEETPNNTSALGQTEERVASDDGRWVVFMSSATDLTPGQVDTNGFTDVFLYDRLTRFTTLVSRSSAAANIASNRMSYDPAISADGRWIVFTSTSTNLITGQSDVTDTEDIFLYDRLNGTRTLVSHRPGLPSTAGSCCSMWPSISADGNTVSFRSAAPNLVAGQTDTNGADDIFLWDRATNTNLLVSHTSASATTAGNGRSWPHVMSGDGAWIAYQSEATNLMSPFTDGNGVQSDTWLWERATNTTTLVSHADGLPTQGANSYPGEMSISADGRYLAHNSAATDLVTGQTGNAGQVFLYDRVTGTNTLASHVPGSTTQGGNSFSDSPVISADGAVVVFETLATNLGTGITDTNSARDLWVHLRATNTNVLVSHTSASTTTTANGASIFPRIDQDGDAIVFQTAATNIAGSDTNGKTDVIFYDRTPRKAWLASRALTSATSAANSDSFAWLGINANGDAAIFASYATNLTALDLNGKQDLFLYSFKPVANLSITNSDGFTTVSPGQSLTWTITVFNLGPEAVTGATVTDAFPATVTGVLWSCTGTGGGTCPASGSGNISASVNLPVGASVTFTANGILDPAASGTLSNTAQVTSTGSVDLDTSDNSATDVDTIQ